MIMAYSYLIRYNNLKSLESNQEYEAEEHEHFLGIINERYASSMDVLYVRTHQSPQSSLEKRQNESV